MKKLFIAAAIVLATGFTAMSLGKKADDKNIGTTKTEKEHFATQPAATTFDVATAD